MTQSSSSPSAGVSASDHAIERYQSRVGVVDITRAELEYRFKTGKPVEVAEKAYHRARLIKEQGSEYILLEKNGCVTTTLFADREEVVRTREG